MRGALCLADQASEQVHNAMYDAQLAMMLPADDEEESKFTDDKMQLLGELEGILQARSPSPFARRRRTTRGWSSRTIQTLTGLPPRRRV